MACRKSMPDRPRRLNTLFRGLHLLACASAFASMHSAAFSNYASCVPSCAFRHLLLLPPSAFAPVLPPSASAALLARACLLCLFVCPPPARYRLCVLERSLVRYGQLLATLCATCSQHLAAIGSSHSCAESVLVDSLTARWLECSLHCHNYLVFIVFTIPLPLHKPCGLGIMRSAKV